MNYVSQLPQRTLEQHPYYLQMNGQCDRFNSTVISMLGISPEQGKLHWQDQVATLVHAYSCIRCTTTCLSPYFLRFLQASKTGIGCIL